MTLTPGRANQGTPAAQANAWFVRPRQLATYGAGYRLAAATAGTTLLAVTFATNTDKQLATIYHLSSSTKTVRVRYIAITLAVGALGVYGFEVRRLGAATAPATGNPAVTPGAFDTSDAAAEATCLALPTTAGTDAAANSPLSPQMGWNSPASVAPSDPGRMDQEIVLYDGRSISDGRKPLTMRAGVQEGLAVIGRCTTAVGLNFTVYIEFTEE